MKAPEQIHHDFPFECSIECEGQRPVQVEAFKQIQLEAFKAGMAFAANIAMRAQRSETVVAQDIQEAARSLILQEYWHCKVHNRQATHRSKVYPQFHVCAPNQPGIMMPCDAVGTIEPV